MRLALLLVMVTILYGYTQRWILVDDYDFTIVSVDTWMKYRSECVRVEVKTYKDVKLQNHLCYL